MSGEGVEGLGGGGEEEGGGGRASHWKEGTKWTVTIRHTLCLVVK